MRKPIIGVMGPGDDASEEDCAMAYELGKLIAERGWILLSGGRASGVMDSVNKGAKEAGGLTIGILTGKDSAEASEAVDIPICTDMGSARNNINILSSDVVIACGNGGPGTASEIALALKAGKSVILLGTSESANAYFQELGKERVFVTNKPKEAILEVEKLL